MQTQMPTEASAGGAARAAQLSFDRPDDRTLVVRFAGNWRVADGVPAWHTPVASQVSGPLQNWPSPRRDPRYSQFVRTATANGPI